MNVNSGTTNFNSNNAIYSDFAASLNLNGGTIGNTSGVAVTLAGNHPTTINADFTFAGTNNLNLGTNGVTMNATHTITTNGTATLTIGGAIANTNTPGLTKAGTGTLELTASNSYTGLTTVSNGTLQFDVSETLTGGLNIATSGTAVLTAHTGGAGNVKVLDIEPLTISGTTPFASGGDKVLSGLASPAPVPEPGTIGLLAVGAIGGLFLRRRNRKSGS